jgi:tyrosinase
MYLYYFERIVRSKSGNANWALPYWNYTPSGTARQLPTQFRNPNNATNALWTSNRGAGWNAGTSSLGNSSVATPGMVQVPFGSFQSSTSGTPHDAIHIALGGWMGSVPTAAQDPVFYLHHANIDRLWNAWLAQGGGRSNPMSNSAQDDQWRTRKFTFFDFDGKQVQLTGCQILRAQAQLQYNYEGEPPQVNQFCKIIFNPDWIKDLVFILDRPFKIPPGPDPGPWELDISKIRQRLATVANDNATDLTLELTGVEADRQPDVYYEVYVGLPKGEKPTSESQYYVGNVALFGHGIRDAHQHGGFKPAEFSFKIDRAVAAAFKRNDDKGRLNIRFVPKGAEGEGAATARKANATLTIRRAAIAVARLSKEQKPA